MCGSGTGSGGGSSPSYSQERFDNANSSPSNFLNKGANDVSSYANENKESLMGNKASYTKESRSGKSQEVTYKVTGIGKDNVKYDQTVTKYDKQGNVTRTIESKNNYVNYASLNGGGKNSTQDLIRSTLNMPTRGNYK